MPKFEPGCESPNPNGRPKGTGHRQQLFNSLVLPHKEGLVGKAIEMAFEGNEPMLRLLLERMLPAKPQVEPLQLAIDGIELHNPRSLFNLGNRVIEKVAEGVLTPEEGQRLSSLIETNRRAVENQIMLQKIEELEHDINSMKVQRPQEDKDGI